MIPIICCIHYKEVFFILQKEVKEKKIIGIGLEGRHYSFPLESMYQTIKECSTLKEGQQELDQLYKSLSESMKKIDIQTLYDVFQEEKNWISFKEMALLIFTKPTCLEELALLQILYQDSLYFTNHNIFYFFPENPEMVLSKKQKQEKKKEDVQVYEQFVSEIIDILQKKRKILSSEEQTKFQSMIQKLLNYLIFENESQHQHMADHFIHRILKAVPDLKKQNDVHLWLFEILCAAGIVSEDENLFLKRYHFDQLFLDTDVLPPIQLQETQKRLDLTNLYTITIDSSDTQDYDDALSLEELSDGFNVYIHIADVAEYVQPNTLLDQKAMARNRTLYLPNQILTMFPEQMSYHIMALKENESKIALTYQFRFDLQHQIKDFQIYESLIQVDRNLSYIEADDILKTQEDSILKNLYEISLSLQKQRIDGFGGVEFLFSQITPKIEEGKITLKVYDSQESQSVFLVKEWMIFTNYMTASLCLNKNYPLLFFNQEAPDVELSLKNRYITEKKQWANVIKHMKKSFIDTVNKGHYTLGVKCYTQSTSPIRRYIDIVSQRQLKVCLKKELSVYEEEDLLKIKYQLELQKKNINFVENETNKYFLLKFIYDHYLNKKIVGVVIKNLSAHHYLVELEVTKNIVKVHSSQTLVLFSVVNIMLYLVIPRIGVALGKVVE